MCIIFHFHSMQLSDIATFAKHLKRYFPLWQACTKHLFTFWRNMCMHRCTYTRVSHNETASLVIDFSAGTNNGTAISMSRCVRHLLLSFEYLCRVARFDDEQIHECRLTAYGKKKREKTCATSFTINLWDRASRASEKEMGERWARVEDRGEKGRRLEG